MLPENGRSADDLLAEIAQLKQHDLPVRGGKVTAYVYDTGRPEVGDAAARAYFEMLEVNTLDPTAFPSAVAMERQVVGAVAGLLGGGPATPGIFTSGGTESIMLAVKAARDSRPVAGRPRMVVPVTAHPAFHKAAHYLGLEVAPVPVDPATFRVVPEAVAEAITPDTVLVVVSAPSYPQGVIDPVAEVAALAAARGVLCHVDACVGGWLLPWLARAGAQVPPFDLSVPGVTSISCDLHKFGYAPKGASVVLFADPALRRAAYFASAAWPGYTVINATVQSSKSAGPLGGAWATLRALGQDGYLALARDTLAATRRLAEGIAAIPGLRVLGTPESSLVAFAGDDVDVFVLADEARRRGWFLQPQLSYAGIPANLHITVTGVTLAGVDALLEVIAVSAEAARAAGPAQVPEGLAELLEGLDLDSIDDATFAELAASVGVDLRAEGQPRMAVVNAVLDALPARTREAILIRFLSVIYG
ncbi:aspartate aminotransferase family protein [Sphaerisporangium melleum]|uniref:Aspartate aminotransferase family protein n=1 Tax=Sphaerisporangium melleum TaxID=321316 RepID=A0A917R7V2_9ACTN|nr:aspartate aminotransferase family protein [Sphaerisporangium melleum]GGK93622.1 aspartate aminotransferase family protein [Sphaerisporangium melleum]GII73389.1 aspartate aminotransferase family protein [Sphaerisporangium melleum]